jgi:M-phase inducer tyrosine phosphatase
MRRAFSVCNPPTPENESSESDFGDSPSTNGVHAEYARRHGKHDGSPLKMRSNIPIVEGSPSRKISPYGPGGLPGFGDNEMDGKILPCHKVKEDGLVRISPETVSSCF